MFILEILKLFMQLKLGIIIQTLIRLNFLSIKIIKYKNE